MEVCDANERVVAMCLDPECSKKSCLSHGSCKEVVQSLNIMRFLANQIHRKPANIAPFQKYQMQIVSYFV